MVKGDRVIFCRDTDAGEDLPDPDEDLPGHGKDLPDPGGDLPDPGEDLPYPGGDLTDLGRDLPDPVWDWMDFGRDLPDPTFEKIPDPNWKNFQHLIQLIEVYSVNCDWKKFDG